MLHVRTEEFELHLGDARECLSDVAPASVRTIVTSPPYFAVRDYGTASWVGGDPACHHGVPARSSRPKNASSTIAGTTKQDGAGAVYREACGLCGALREDAQVGIEATVDGYVAALVDVFARCRHALAPDGTVWLNLGDSYASGEVGRHDSLTSTGTAAYSKFAGAGRKTKRLDTGLKRSDLTGTPWRVALALQADGWYLRSCVVWDKSNGMPESAKNRPTDAHEYVFLLSREPSYYFSHRGEKHVRSVWRGPTAGYKGAHTAVMPLWLARRCVLLTSRSGDTVLDPFAGSGTTLVAACGYKRRAVGIDLLPDNVRQQARRILEEAFGSELVTLDPAAA